jgi:hypothetical protein
MKIINYTNKIIFRKPGNQKFKKYLLQITQKNSCENSLNSLNSCH